MPFTTMNNYNWLFDVGETRLPITTQQNISMIPDAQQSTRDHQLHTTAYQSTTQSESDIYRLNFGADGHPTASLSSLDRQPTILQPQQSSDAFPASEMYQYTSMPDLRAPGPTTVSPSSIEMNLTTNSSPEADFSRSTAQNSTTNPLYRGMSSSFTSQNLPPSLPQRRMPTIDDLSRNQILDLVENARPKTPEGAEITREHALLSLSSMQNYLDLFFSRFNVAYPLLHQATFDPSQTEPLLLLAVLLLGATYSEKATHGMAVCIHDVLRAQIFQHAAFSATPELWMLQTILLVECFGKSRAGQKQHDMAHLFHGLLIK